MQKAPEQIGPYRIRNKIGESPLYIEYLASDSQHEQDVVLRVPGEAFPRTPARLTRFVTAGQRAARLQHEHIVPIIDAGQADGEYYIATAYVAGQRLTDLLASSGKAVGVERVAPLIDGIAAALDYAHSQGIDHEGLTTDNVILTQDGRVLVTDFCLAEGLDSSELVHSEDDPAFASYFLAPEQVRTDVDSDYRADIYSLGVVAYAMLTRNLPFEALTQGELLHKIVNDIPRSPDLLNPQLPAGVAYVLRNVLAKEPEVRYSSAGDFHDALLAGMAWTAPAGAGAGGVEIPPQRSRRGLVSALLALLILALIAGGAYFVLQTDVLPAELTGMVGGGATETATAEPTDDAAMAIAAASESGGTETASTESASDETSQENAGSVTDSESADAQGETTAALQPTEPSAQAPAATPSPTHTLTATPTESATATPTATPTPTVDEGEETDNAAADASNMEGEDETENGAGQSGGAALRLPTPTTVANGVTNGGAATGASQSAAAVASEMTATNTPQATATNTTAPTATNTAAPAATNTPRPTATNTSAPAATNTPRPTATNTSAPTATNTPRPTATNTSAPAATNTPRPTATNTSTPTATNTPRPTATNTSAPTATNTPRPTATNTSAPTATNTPAPPPPTNTATNTPAPLPTATSTPIPTGSDVVQLLAPASGSAGSGSQTFTWSTSLTPPAGQAFELVFWPAGQSPMARGFGMAAPTTGNQLNINLSALDNSGDHPLEPGDYQWGLLLVQTEPSYQRIQFLGAQSAFRYYREGGGSSGGDPGGPPSTGE